MTTNDDIKKILGISNPNIVIIKSERLRVQKVDSIVVSVKSNREKYRCPICNKYTNSIHDKLKPTMIKMLSINGNNFYIKEYKRRFICHSCNKKFNWRFLSIKLKNNSISNVVIQKVLKDLLNPNKNIKTIAKDNNISTTKVRDILKDATKNYSDHLNSLPEIISFDEFKADTTEGKYAFIINDIIHKRTLEILPNRRKDYLENYFEKVPNRHNVKYVICDMYEPYLIVVKTMFPKAKFVVDRFHYVRYIMDALDKVRIRLQKEYGYNSKEYRLLKNKKVSWIIKKILQWCWLV